MLLIVVIIIAFVLIGGGGFYSPGDGVYPYRRGGIGIGGLLIICLVIYLLLGHRL